MEHENNLWGVFWFLTGFALIISSIFTGEPVMLLGGLVIVLLSSRIIRQGQYIEQLEDEVDELTDDLYVGW